MASRYKVARPLRTKQAVDVADMIVDIYKVAPLTYPLSDGPERAFVSEELMLIPEDTELSPNYVQKW